MKLADKSLTVKVITVVSLLSLLVIGLIVLVNTISQQRQMRRELSTSIDSLAEMIYNGIKFPMARGDSHTIRQQMNDFKKNSLKAEIQLFGFDGKIVYSSNEDDVGKNLGAFVRSQELANEIGRLLQEGGNTEKGIEEVFGEMPYISFVRSIDNESQCHHCHGSSRKVLGGLMLRQPAFEFYEAIRSLRNQGLLIGFFGLVLIVVT